MSLEWFIFFSFPLKTVYAFLFSSICATCPPSHPLWCNALIIFGDIFKSWSSSLCILLQPPITSWSWGQKIFLNTLFWNTLSLCCSLNMKDQVLHPCKSKDSIIVHDMLTFWHRSFTFNSNKSPTWCNNFSVYYPDVCLQLNMFRAFSLPSSGAQWLQWQLLVLPLYRGDSHAVFVVGPARPRTQHDCHHDTKVKSEASTAVIELLMMGGKTPETCWAVNLCKERLYRHRCWSGRLC